MRILAIILAIAIALCGAIYFYPDYIKKYSTLLRLNSNSPGKLPRNFRMSHLKASGSSQFTEADLKKILETITHDRVVVVDLREEPHGFLNGDAISWYNFNNWLNRGKTKEEIRLDEQERLGKLSYQLFTILYFKHGHYPHLYRIREVASSEKVALRNGAEYIQFPVSDHQHPDNHIVDDFVAFIKNLDEDTWLHFHCSAGKGRTTTFLAMYDIMLNASNTTLEEIAAKQLSYGGINLLEEPDNWKISHAQNRTSFIKNFYQYCIENTDFALSWSVWEKRRMKEEL